MTTADFRRILDAQGISPIDRIAKEYRINLSVSDALKQLLAEKAFASGLGCRAIYSEIKRRLNGLLFSDCKRNHYHLDIADPLTPSGTRSPAQVPALAAADAGHY